MNEPTELNLTILVGRVSSKIKRYDDGGAPKAVFTVAQRGGRQRFYVECLGRRAQEAAALSPGCRVLVVGRLFSGRTVGLRAEQIVPLERVQKNWT